MGMFWIDGKFFEKRQAENDTSRKRVSKNK